MPWKSIVNWIAKPTAGFKDPPVILAVIVKQQQKVIDQNIDIRVGSLMLSDCSFKIMKTRHIRNEPRVSRQHA